MAKMLDKDFNLGLTSEEQQEAELMGTGYPRPYLERLSAFGLILIDRPGSLPTFESTLPADAVSFLREFPVAVASEMSDGRPKQNWVNGVEVSHHRDIHISIIHMELTPRNVSRTGWVSLLCRGRELYDGVEISGPARVDRSAELITFARGFALNRQLQEEVKGVITVTPALVLYSDPDGLRKSI